MHSRGRGLATRAKETQLQKFPPDEDGATRKMNYGLTETRTRNESARRTQNETKRIGESGLEGVGVAEKERDGE